ncbi:hypothetical protein MNBD_NITROSPINAE02-794 [hydrothermal vent metagenome]|uniref:Uncharacterized protein n=1 Tax=hydrothermal vent metagenome TaxID=652676 RepID=A0A3B1C4W3_9ZZZZ
MQLIGIVTACFALIFSFNNEGEMGTMLRWGGAGLVEFYIGYALTAFAGKK